MKEKWEYFSGDFVADQYNDTLLKYSPWSGHRRFGYDLVSYYEPENLVELGSHYGGSMFAFAQAVRDGKLKTTCYAIDLWEATDIYTKHDYERDVYTFFKDIREKEFIDIKIHMMKTSFDEALGEFDDQSVEILHIDGSHEYEDVKNDFKNWLPKMKKEGVILFHDISDQRVFDEVMGSCIFWIELKKKYPFTVDMQYSWGLGILFLSEDKYRDFINKVDLDYYLKMNTYDENIAKDRIRTDYFKLLDANKWIKSLKADKESADEDNSRLLCEIDTIQQNYKKTDEAKNVYVEELKKTIQEYGQSVEDKDTYIEELKDTISGYEETFVGKDRYIEELKDTVISYEETFAGKDRYIEELKDTLSSYEGTFAGKDKYIEDLLTAIDAYNQENMDIRAAYEQTIEAKDAYIEELSDTIQGYEETFAGKDRYIEELLATIEAYKKEVQDVKNAYEQTIAGKDAYIVELESMKKTRR